MLGSQVRLAISASPRARSMAFISSTAS
jgi:hypothetical protein